MKFLIWLCASVCIAACAAEAPVDVSGDEHAAASELVSTPSVLINAVPTDSPERIQSVAAAISAAACHGTTTCAGPVIGPVFTVDCGPQLCGTTGCGKPGVGPLRAHKVQPREQYQAYDVGGTVCLAYHPTTSGLLSTCCLVDD